MRLVPFRLDKLTLVLNFTTSFIQFKIEYSYISHIDSPFYLRELVSMDFDLFKERAEN